MATSSYPPVSFHFLVEFPEISSNSQDNRFQSVSGMTVDLDIEEVAEGGENRFVHKIPVRTRYRNLVLKRGLLMDSDVINWLNDAMEKFKFKPTTVVIKLLNEKHEPLLAWNFVHAYPVKWMISDLDATQSQLAIETLELSYNYFTRI